MPELHIRQTVSSDSPRNINTQAQGLVRRNWDGNAFLNFSQQTQSPRVFASPGTALRALESSVQPPPTTPGALSWQGAHPEHSYITRAHKHLIHGVGWMHTFHDGHLIRATGDKTKSSPICPVNISCMNLCNKLLDIIILMQAKI